jgi:hypothetical protein
MHMPVDDNKPNRTVLVMILKRLPAGKLCSTVELADGQEVHVHALILRSHAARAHRTRFRLAMDARTGGGVLRGPGCTTCS